MGTEGSVVAPGALAVTVLMVSIGVVFVLGRFYSSIFLYKKLKDNDYACLVAAVFAFAYGCIVITFAYEDTHGGIFSGDFSAKAAFAASILASPATFFSKFAILLFLLRVFKPDVAFRRCLFAGFAVNGLIFIGNIPLYPALCSPTNGSWIEAAASERCQDLDYFGLVQGILDVLLNLYLVVLPMPVVWKLQMTLKKKLGVMFMFMHGIFALVASIVGLYYRAKLINSVDRLYYQTAVMVCLVVENSMTIICSSMHACGAYLRATASQRRASIASFLNRRASTFSRRTSSFTKRYSASSSSPASNPPTPGQEKFGAQGLPWKQSPDAASQQPAVNSQDWAGVLEKPQPAKVHNGDKDRAVIKVRPISGSATSESVCSDEKS